VGDGRVSFTNAKAEVMSALTGRFVQQEFAPGEAIAELGKPISFF
jgi:hypothetical protein